MAQARERKDEIKSRVPSGRSRTVHAPADGEVNRTASPMRSLVRRAPCVCRQSLQRRDASPHEDIQVTESIIIFSRARFWLWYKAICAKRRSQQVVSESR